MNTSICECHFESKEYDENNMVFFTSNRNEHDDVNLINIFAVYITGVNIKLFVATK